MITPTATDFEVAPRKAFAVKSHPPDKQTRGAVARLNVGFQAMKPMNSERLAEHGAQATAHVAMPVVRREGVVPKIGRLKRPTHDLANIDYASKLAIACTNPVPNVSRPTKALEISAPSDARSHPRSVARSHRPTDWLMSS